MPGPLLSRRGFLRAAGSTFVAGLAPEKLFALERTDAVFAAAFMDPAGRFGLATIAEDGTIIDRSPLPHRAHGLAFDPHFNRVVAFARRPGTFAAIFDRTGRVAPVVIASPEGRHFYGHGTFSVDGRLLYASENDFDHARGVIGIYDATNGFARIGEHSTFGVGPHDLSISLDGKVLIAANGGIETHPDFGRTKLNLDRMEPSLALIDASSGALIEKHELPANLKQLSTRHIDLSASNDIWFACQYEGARDDLPPLVGRFRPGDALQFIELPEATARNLANYVGAIAVNRAEGLVAATSPRGGTYVVLEAKSGRLLREVRLTGASGIAAGPHGFGISTERGVFDDRQSQVNWDQHVVRLG
ncbi:MAG TPA: DUF1513 domain-containing protein [Ensifer sp.]|nr:DUF1513 domain-containing protein [Ensifer sp.]